MRTLILTSGLALIAAFASPEAAEARSCDAIAGDVAAATGNADTDRLIALYREAETASPACSDTYRVCLGRAVAHGFVDRAYTAYDRQAPVAELEGLIAEARAWGQTWKVLLAEAELAEERKAYDDAALYYQAALNDLAETSPCAGEEEGMPDEAGLRQIFDRAQVAGLLSKDFVEPPKDRNNDPGGIFLPSVRGIAPKERALPVEFEFDSAAFTPKGAKAIDALAGYVTRNASKFPVIRLSGHTDRIGSQGYNCGLSARRLTAVAEYLYQVGVPRETPIEILPQGKAHPYAFDDASRYTQDEIDQANRRVVLIEGSAPVARACP